MPLKIPITYNSKKIGEFGWLLFKIGRVIFCLVLILGIIYFGYKYYLNKNIYFSFLVGVLLYTLFDICRKYFKKKNK